MHEFEELADRSISFVLDIIEQTRLKIFKDLEVRASTVSVKNLQMLRLQMAVQAVGLFSILDAELQFQLGGSNGFDSLRKLMVQLGEEELCTRFEVMVSAINVLKHGYGRSYKALTEQGGYFNYAVKGAADSFHFEGDVSEVNTIIDVSETFLKECGVLIGDLMKFVRFVTKRVSE